jgi:hypothetical protein
VEDERVREESAMKALVVYESLYGNTATIGEAIAASLREHGLQTIAGPVSKIAPSEAAGFDLLVVGGPTHAHGMSRPETRDTAVRDKNNTFAEPTVLPGLREWIDGLPVGDDRLTAAFDTRIDKPAILTGSAAKKIASRLEKHGYRLITAPESFFVSMKKHLRDGEIDHAAGWGTQLAQHVSEGGASDSRRYQERELLR